MVFFEHLSHAKVVSFLMHSNDVLKREIICAYYVLPGNFVPILVDNGMGAVRGAFQAAVLCYSVSE